MIEPDASQTKTSWTHAHLFSLLVELGLIIGFAVWLTWPYLGGTSRSSLPAGLDFVVSIQGRFFWNHVRECGSCALWNGDLAGGSPALIDTSTDMLHPLAAIPVLLLGVLEGSRVGVTLAVITSGIGSWWLAYLLRTSWMARLFAGGLGVAGGHITGRLDYGLVVLMTSIATASLLLPAVIWFSRRYDRRSTALVGVLLGLLIVSGQAYIQIGVLLLALAVLWLIARNGRGWRLSLLRIGQMALIGLMVASPLWFPVWHFRSSIEKDSDPTFSRSQPFRYVPLNLVIDREDYFSSSMFKQAGFPGWHVNYIGWIPILFALAGIGFLWARSKRETLFLLTLTIGALWLGSGDLFQWVAHQSILEEFSVRAAQLRTTSNIANLAVPAIIGLAACGVERVRRFLESLGRLRIAMPAKPETRRRVITMGLGLLLIIPLVFSLRDVFWSARQWNSFLGPTATAAPEISEFLESPELRWVDGNFMTFELSFYGLEHGLKLGNQWQPWRLSPAREPAPGVWASINGAVDGTTRIDGPPGFEIYVPNDGNPYAQLLQPDGSKLNCTATGRGARIDVRCPSGTSGSMTVQERYVEGWSASVDGKPIAVGNHDGWVGIEVPAGATEVALRYHSPFFRSTVFIALLGVLWAIWWIGFPDKLQSIDARVRRM